jgi:hypothetical protein
MFSETYQAYSSSFSFLKTLGTLSVEGTPIIPVLGRLRQEDLELEAWST